MELVRLGAPLLWVWWLRVNGLWGLGYGVAEEAVDEGRCLGRGGEEATM